MIYIKAKVFNMFKKLLLILLLFFVYNPSYGKTIEIQMLNKLGKEKMVYSVTVAKVDVNDIVIWKSVSKGHNVQFISMPKGVKKFKSKINKDAQYTFTIPGIYLYQCTPHKAMGMIGIVVVGGDKHNLKKIKKAKLYGKSKKVFKKLIKQL